MNLSIFSFQLLNYKDTEILSIIIIVHAYSIQCHNLKSRQINCIQFLGRIQGQRIKSFWSFWILFTPVIKKAACCLIRWSLGGCFINLLIPWRKKKTDIKNKSKSKTYLNEIHLHWEHISILCQIKNFCIEMFSFYFAFPKYYAQKLNISVSIESTLGFLCLFW